MAKAKKRGEELVPVTLNLPRGLVKQVDRLAKGQGVSRSAWVRLELETLVDGQRAVSAVLNNPAVGPYLAEFLSSEGVVRGMLQQLGQPVDEGQLQLFQEGLQSALRPAARKGANRCKR